MARKTGGVAVASKKRHTCLVQLLQFLTYLIYIFTIFVLFKTFQLLYRNAKSEQKAIEEGIPLNCPSCKMWIPVGATVCGHCARDIVVEQKAIEEENPSICPQCKEWIPVGKKVCWYCA